jgi:hypothetical protein
MVVAADVHADEFVVQSVNGRWAGNVYELSGTAYTPLKQPALEALSRGVALTITYDIEVNRLRSYWLDERIALLQQRFQLRYHALTDQYLLVNLNTGVQQSYPSVDAALRVANSLTNFPVLDRQLLQAGSNYQARMRVRLDTDSLPAPLRLVAYVTPSWWMTSDWYIWKVKM